MKFTIYRNALKAVSRFSAVKDIRFYLNGVFVESNPMQTRLVATDGHTLIVHRSDAKDENEGSFSGIIPSDAVKAILAWKAPSKYQKDLPVIVSTLDDIEYRADWLGMTCVFKLIDGKFPDYRKVIPRTVSGLHSHYDPDLMVRLKRASEDLGSDKGYFEFQPNGADKPENEGPGIGVINDSCVVVVMPMRGFRANAENAQWAIEELPVLAKQQETAPGTTTEKVEA